jgi:YD repeat-containing protein
MRIMLPLLAFACICAGSASGQAFRGKVDVQKKIAAATPPALPQSPGDGRIRSDAQDENLRGKVKSVATRRADNASRDYPKRKLVREDFYNEAGNRVRGIDWSDDWPTAVTVFGYIDGMRVSRGGIVEYAAGERPPTEGCVPLVHSIVEPEQPVGDTRYGTRWVYKYDGRGRLVEEIHLNNRGATLTRTVYNHETDTRRVVSHFAAGIEPLARVIEIIDPQHGNVIEERLHDEFGEVNLIRYYSYKFDDRGNWIEQKVTEREPNDKGRPKPVEAAFRTIEYYR